MGLRECTIVALLISLCPRNRALTPLTVVMVDIDNFKEYHDRHGHLAGDAARIEIARALNDCAQRSGDLLAQADEALYAAKQAGKDRASAYDSKVEK